MGTTEHINAASINLAGEYNLIFVALSVLIAIAASFTALDMVSRISRSERPLMKISGGSLAMGMGIWSMHFIGMQAFMLPVQISYDISTTLLSLLVAILTSAFSLYLLNHSDRINIGTYVFGGIIMGLGIASMHYIGMAAMRFQGAMNYNPILLAASIVIAIMASITALWMAGMIRRNEYDAYSWIKILCAIIMGLAIAGMHYTGMAAATFSVNAASMGHAAAVGIADTWIIAILSLSVLLIGLMAVISEWTASD